MLKKPAILLPLIAILVGCGPITPAGSIASPAPQPSETAPPATPDDQAGHVETAAIRQLAGNLGLGSAEIAIVSDDVVQFEDSCLGVQLPDVQCAQAVTPGRIVVLEAGGIRFEYHTSADGGRVQPASMTLSWQREGGIAGFCDRLVVFRSGEVYGNQCAAEGRMGTFASLLDAQERDEFLGWLRKYSDVQIDASNPKGVADRMLVVLSFEGVGSAETASAAEQQELLRFAASLYGKLSNQGVPQ